MNLGSKFFQIYIFSSLVSGVLPTPISSALHFIIVRPLAIWVIARRFRSVYIIILLCLLLPALFINLDYYINAEFDSYLIFIYFYLTIIFYDVGLRFNATMHGLLRYTPHAVVVLTGIQLGVLFWSYLDPDFSLYLISRGIEPTRISLGNALEVQITLTTLAYAFQKSINKKGVGATLIVLCLSNAIAQTRIMIVCSFAMLFKSISRHSFKWLVLGLIFGIGVIFGIGEYFEIERMRFSDLVSGGSTLDRLSLISIAYKLIFSSDIIFGYGAGGFSYYHVVDFGVKKSVENLFIQVLIEFGVFGLCLFIVSVAAPSRRFAKVKFNDPILLILLFQIIFMMPINAMLPVQAFLIGIIIASRPESPAQQPSIISQ